MTPELHGNWGSLLTDVLEFCMANKILGPLAELYQGLRVDLFGVVDTIC